MTATPNDRSAKLSRFDLILRCAQDNLKEILETLDTEPIGNDTLKSTVAAAWNAIKDHRHEFKLEYVRRENDQ